MPEPIDFYFDFSSPYGYVAAQRIETLGLRHNRVISWRPILLGPAMKLSGNRPLKEQAMKGDYMTRDVPRLCRHDRIPFAWPEPFPVAALAPTRGFYWITEQNPDQAVAYAKAVYHAYFVDGRNVAEAEVATAVADEVGLDPAAFAAAIQDPDRKARTKAAVDAAIKRGVFGSPMVFVDEEPFWGVDRLALVDDWLARGGW